MRARLRWRDLAVHPFLGAMYPVLALAAANSDEVTHLTLLVRPLLISLGVAACLWCVALPLVRNSHRRGLLVLVGVLFFAGYGHWLRELRESRFVDLFYLGLTFPIWVAAGAWLASLALRIRRDLAPVTQFLNIMALVMLAFPVIGLVRAARLDRVEPLPLDAVPQRAGALQPPDVYVIIVDEYSAGRWLANLYGHDNSGFEDALRARGFAVPREANANYIHTFLSLASMLNWTYLDEAATRLGKDRADRKAIYPWIESNRAFRFFEQQGYELLFLRSAYEPTRVNRHVDVVVPEHGRSMGEFQHVWVGTTLLVRSVRLTCRLVPCWGPDTDHGGESNEVMDFRFEWLAQVAGPSSRPRFVFAHLLVPHDPFMYHADCRPRDPRYWISIHVTEPSDLARQVYAEQVECVNRRLLGVVDSILIRSPRPPVILIQSDHGNGMLGWPHTPRTGMSAERIADRMGVFAAYHLPGPDAPRLPDSIEPIDIFPVVLNHYFGTRLPLQGGRTYWSEWETPYRYVRVR